MTTDAPVSLFPETAQNLLCTRYFHRGPKHPVCSRCNVAHENEEQLIARISLYNPKYMEKLFTPIRFLPNSPTIFNLPCEVCGETEPAGTFSACFKFDVADTMESIMDVAKKAGMVLKFGGGVGYYVGGLRAKGSPIRSTHGEACGPVAVIRHYQSVAELVTQGGKRFAAQMAILDDDHPDVFEFIHMKDDDPQALNAFNISVAASDAFMERSENNELFDQIVKAAWRTGDPGLYFKDTAEKTNPTPWLGELTGTNPCGEVCLLDNEPCDLGSIDLSKFYTDDHDLEETVRTAIRYLDEILDRNVFPTPEIDEAARTTRKLGLGVMGWADLLAMRGLPYSSGEAIALGGEIMSNINTIAHDESYRLSQNKGTAPCFNDQGMLKRRNATLTCIAPTGSISILAGCSSGIEPHYALQYTHERGDGELTTFDLTEKFGGFQPEIANQIHWTQHLAHQAAFQRHTDLAVSKTINMPNAATLEDVAGAYWKAWRWGCKGVTIFRDGCRDGGEQVLRDTTTIRKKTLTEVAETNLGADLYIQGDRRERLPADRQAHNHRFQVGDQEGYLNIGMYDDGRPGEVFITASQQGSTVRGLLDGIGILSSLCLQYGVPVDVIARKFRRTSFEPAGMTQNPTIPFATSILDYLGHFLETKFPVGTLDPVAPTDIMTNMLQITSHNGNGDACPNCGNRVIYAEGCSKCSAGCGWTRC